MPRRATSARTSPSLRAYQDLEARFRRLSLLGSVQGMLDWDSATMMPAGGAPARTEQMTLLATIAHRELTEPKVLELAAQAGRARLTPWQSANLSAMRWHLRHARAVPDDLVEALGRATARCEVAWRVAKPASDFRGLAKHLGEVLRLVREKAAAKAAVFGGEPYAALLDQFNPGLTAADIDPVFDDLALALPPLVHEALAAQAKRRKPAAMRGPFAAPAQQTLGREVMTALGFDFTHGRLDESAHPFTGGVPDDVRLTSRPLAHDVLSGLMAVVHETGHALYERGLPAAWRWQPVGEAAGSAMHEAQALLWEMQVGRSRSFLNWVSPRLRKALGRSGPAFTNANIAARARAVRPGPIRVDADEVTYPLHVILRYRLEQQLIGGSLAINDLPDAWNHAMRTLVGITPKNHAQGCLQDIHWTYGSYGYFPSYALGAVAAAQMFKTAAKADRRVRPGIVAGKPAPLLAWLRANIHTRGSRYAPAQLLKRATGQSFEAGALIAHLRARYVDGGD